MSDAPVVLGVNRTQNASVCLMQGSRMLWAVQKPGDVRDFPLSRLPWPERPIDVLVECDAADDEGRQLPLYGEDLAPGMCLAPGCRHTRISRHLAHAYSVFHPSPLREAAVMIVGGQGSRAADLSEYWAGAAYVPGDWREVASFYRADRERVLCVGKQVWNGDDARLGGLGMFYALLTQALFPGKGNEAKVMELAAHGDPHALGLPPLSVEAGQVGVPAPWRELLSERDHFRYGQPGVRFADCANLAAAGQRAFEEAVLEVARWLHAQTRLDSLCFAGGAALNASANGRLLRETPFRRIFIPPAPGAAGTALGCALYGLTELAGESCAYRWTHDYLGPAPGRHEIEAALLDRDDLRIEELPSMEALCSRMLDLLASRRVIALVQGGREFGPRALGHRSILADPRHAAMHDWINAKLRQREWFRPLFPAVLEERAADWFDLPAPSPFMQFAASVRPGMAAWVPAITQTGGGARPQTVGVDGDPLLRRLLQGFDAMTGVPMLVHTSLRGQDEAIVETPQQAIDAFRRMPLHALAMPPFLITKRSEPELPA